VLSHVREAASLLTIAKEAMQLDKEGMETRTKHTIQYTQDNNTIRTIHMFYCTTNLPPPGLETAFPHLNARQVHKIALQNNSSEQLGIAPAVLDGFLQRFVVTEKLPLEVDRSVALRDLASFKLV
jgi:hypothetical protein